jgi:hypothetical protein
MAALNDAKQNRDGAGVPPASFVTASSSRILGEIASSVTLAAESDAKWTSRVW